MKQLGLGFIQYAQDYDETLPLFSNYLDPGSPTPRTWDLLIQPYLKSMQILVCPSDSASPVFANLPGFGTNVRRSYAYANYLRVWNQPCAGETGFGKNLAAIPSVSVTLLLAERRGEGNGNTPGDWANNSNINATDAMAGISGRQLWQSPPGTEAIHLGTSDYLFADGHVKAGRGVTGAMPTLPGHPAGNTNQGTWVNCQQDLPL